VRDSLARRLRASSQRVRAAACAAHFVPAAAARAVRGAVAAMLPPPAATIADVSDTAKEVRAPTALHVCAP
jgi:hypothetical protein